MRTCWSRRRAWRWACSFGTCPCTHRMSRRRRSWTGGRTCMCACRSCVVCVCVCLCGKVVCVCARVCVSQTAGPPHAIAAAVAPHWPRRLYPEPGSAPHSQCVCVPPATACSACDQWPCSHSGVTGSACCRWAVQPCACPRAAAVFPRVWPLTQCTHRPALPPRPPPCVHPLAGWQVPAVQPPAAEGSGGRRGGVRGEVQLRGTADSTCQGGMAGRCGRPDVKRMCPTQCAHVHACVDLLWTRAAAPAHMWGRPRSPTSTNAAPLSPLPTSSGLPACLCACACCPTRAACAAEAPGAHTSGPCLYRASPAAVR